MAGDIETRRQPDGLWVATVHSVPGLATFGDTPEASVAAAEQVAAILRPGSAGRGRIILGFYPGRIPDGAQAGAELVQ